MRESFDTLLTSYNVFAEMYNSTTDISQRKALVLTMCQTYTDWGWDSFNVAMKDYSKN